MAIVGGVATPDSATFDGMVTHCCRRIVIQSPRTMVKSCGRQQLAAVVPAEIDCWQEHHA